MKEFIDKLIGRLEEEKGNVDVYCTPDEKRLVEHWNDCVDNTIEIVNELAEEYKGGCCEWKFTKSVVDSAYFYSGGCNHKRFSDLHSFEFCPYCGKKIKVVK